MIMSMTNKWYRKEKILIFKCEDNIMNHDSFHMHRYKRLNQCHSFDPADCVRFSIQLSVWERD